MFRAISPAPWRPYHFNGLYFDPEFGSQQHRSLTSGEPLTHCSLRQVTLLRNHHLQEASQHETFVPEDTSSQTLVYAITYGNVFTLLLYRLWESALTRSTVLVEGAGAPASSAITGVAVSAVSRHYQFP